MIFPNDPDCQNQKIEFVVANHVRVANLHFLNDGLFSKVVELFVFKILHDNGSIAARK
jgi:hypothetical protein